MKYDLSKQLTRGAKRTLSAFSETMFTLISQKPFEKITVNEICQASQFPRATFYNYFEDKYDLLTYCWHLLAAEIEVDNVGKIESDQALMVYFDRFYDLLQQQQLLLNQILQNNQLPGALANSFISYLKKIMQQIFYKSLTYIDNDQVPIELMADHFSETVILILEWIFLKQKSVTKAEAHQYLGIFLNWTKC